MRDDREHKCGKIPGQYEVVRNELVRKWHVYRLMVAVLRDITYCPYCGVELD
jgi:hypothetical protein